MSRVFDVSAQEGPSLIRFAESEADIERICKEHGDQENPPEALLLSGDPIGNSLLLVNRGFLERGQSLPCPSLPLAGAAFDPDWGFASAAVGIRPDGSAQFRPPPGRFENSADGDTWGYRMSPIENNELAGVLRQLARIRALLTKPLGQINESTGVYAVVVGL